MRLPARMVLVMMTLTAGVVPAVSCGDRGAETAPPVPTAAAGTAATAPSWAPGFRAVYFADPLHGWAAGDLGIIATTDGGRSWQFQRDGPPAVIELQFTSIETGWALGPDFVLRTTDGGQHWTTTSIPPPLEDMNVISDLEAWIETDGTWAIHTVDGAHSWTPGTYPLKDNGCTSDMAQMFIQDRPGPFDSSSGVQLDTDGLTGGRWNFACFGSIVWLALTGNHAAFHESYLMLRSADGGAHWAPVLTNWPGRFPGTPGGSGATLGPMSFVNATTAFVTGECGPCQLGEQVSLQSTSDGGATWHWGSAPPLLEAGGYHVMFVDADHGWVATDDGRIYATSDGAGSWVLVYGKQRP